MTACPGRPGLAELPECPEGLQVSGGAPDDLGGRNRDVCDPWSDRGALRAEPAPSELAPAQLCSCVDGVQGDALIAHRVREGRAGEPNRACFRAPAINGGERLPGGTPLPGAPLCMFRTPTCRPRPPPPRAPPRPRRRGTAAPTPPAPP